MTDRTPPGRKNPNPQGKGLVPVLQDLQLVQQNQSGQKNPLEFFRDYCVSSLVLAAEFRFKPVPHKNYYLYSTEAGWNLSLVSPKEWHDRPPGEFVANCSLKPDMTWKVLFHERAGEGSVRGKLEAHTEAFFHSLEDSADIAQQLPFYVAHLPYYRRVMASALAASLKNSMPETVELKKLARSLKDRRALLGPRSDKP